MDFPHKIVCGDRNFSVSFRDYVIKNECRGEHFEGAGKPER
jgi:hypothetical protein